MIEQAFRDFVSYLDVPLHIAVMVPLAVAAVIHALRITSARPALVKGGPWEGMPKHRENGSLPVVIAIGCLLVLAIWLAEYSGVLNFLSNRI